MVAINEKCQILGGFRYVEVRMLAANTGERIDYHISAENLHRQINLHGSDNLDDFCANKLPYNPGRIGRVGSLCICLAAYSRRQRLS